MPKTLYGTVVWYRSGAVRGPESRGVQLPASVCERGEAMRGDGAQAALHRVRGTEQPSTSCLKERGGGDFMLVNSKSVKKKVKNLKRLKEKKK